MAEEVRHPENDTIRIELNLPVSSMVSLKSIQSILGLTESQAVEVAILYTATVAALMGLKETRSKEDDFTAKV